MKYMISKNILKDTTKCRDNFACLRGDKHCICDIDDCSNGNVHFIRPLGNNMCEYKMAFGYSFTCNCPVRKEMYNLYRV